MIQCLIISPTVTSNSQKSSLKEEVSSVDINHYSPASSQRGKNRTRDKNRDIKISANNSPVGSRVPEKKARTFRYSGACAREPANPAGIEINKEEREREKPGDDNIFRAGV